MAGAINPSFISPREKEEEEVVLQSGTPCYKPSFLSLCAVVYLGGPALQLAVAVMAPLITSMTILAPRWKWWRRPWPRRKNKLLTWCRLLKAPWPPCQTFLSLLYACPKRTVDFALFSSKNYIDRFKKCLSPPFNNCPLPELEAGYLFRGGGKSGKNSGVITIGRLLFSPNR